MNKRKIVMMALSIMMVAILAVGGSLAYLTDTDERANVFTVGNVQIVQNEKDRTGEDFKDNQKLLPIVNDGKDTNGYHTGENYIDKIVTVTNTGTEPAYIRTYLAIPAVLDDGPTTYDANENILHWNGASATDTFGLANLNMDNDWYWGRNFSIDWPAPASDNWNGYQTTVEGVLYNVYVATHKAPVAAGATTAPTLYGVYLDKGVDYNGTSYVDQNGDPFTYPEKVQVLVASVAVQSEGFDDAFVALEEAFGAVGTFDPFGGTVGIVFGQN